MSAVFPEQLDREIGLAGNLLLRVLLRFSVGDNTETPASPPTPKKRARQLRPRKTS
jgi:hypothetical protein